MNLQNQIVWITGASSGIGEALAYQFARAGAKLILSARRAGELERVKANCIDSPEVFLLPLDLAETENLPEKATIALKHFGQIDVLVNNAGISQRGLAKDTLLEVDRRIMEVNFFGTVALTKAVLPSMLARKDGHIIVISSIVGKIGVPLRTAYSASKHALHGFFDALRAESYQENVKILMVCPGFVQTEVSKNALKGDGTTHNKMDETTAAGLTAEKCAQQVLKALRKDKEEVIISGLREKYGVFMKRFFPRMLSKILRKAKTT